MITISIEHDGLREESFLRMRCGHKYIKVLLEKNTVSNSPVPKLSVTLSKEQWLEIYL